MPLVGIIANPASGKDIRRLVAHGSVFDNQEKVRIVRRLLTGLAATGVDQVCFMPDYYGIVPRALRELDLDLKVFPANFKPYGNQDDTVKAAGIMVQREAACIITLGGDGTNRAVVKGARNIPILPISTGTNNVFPRHGGGDHSRPCGRPGGHGPGADRRRGLSLHPFWRWLWMAKPADVALVDAAVCDERFIGSRAVWDMTKIKQLFLNRARPDSIGLFVHRRAFGHPGAGRTQGHEHRHRPRQKSAHGPGCSRSHEQNRHQGH